MITTKMFCDKCKEEIVDHIQMRVVWKEGNKRMHVILCEKCKELVKEFLNK